MADPRAVTRVFDELLFRLRREGFSIAPSQAVDAMRALLLVGLDDKATVLDALAAVVVKRPEDRAKLERIAHAYFAAERVERGDLWARLRARGFSEVELEVVRAFFDATVGGGDAPEHAVDAPRDAELAWDLLSRGAGLDRMLTGADVRALLERARNPLQAGFAATRALSLLPFARARDGLSPLRVALSGAFGTSRGDALAKALADELEETGTHVRAWMRMRIQEDAAEPRERSLAATPFVSLNDAELEEVRQAVRRLAERLRGGARVRLRRAKRGRIDVAKTMRRAMRTFGVPFAPVRRARLRDKPKLVLLCDVSDSVRTAARFMLEFVYAAQELFERTRSFVFVSELGEATRLFAEKTPNVALAEAYGGGVVSVAENSNYGRVLATFEREHLSAIDRRTTVVILGDGRTNYHADAADVLDRIRARARALLWLCPERRAQWGIGDSAMARYAPRCTRVLEVATAAELETAARAMLALR